MSEHRVDDVVVVSRAAIADLLGAVARVVEELQRPPAQLEPISPNVTQLADDAPLLISVTSAAKQLGYR